MQTPSADGEASATVSTASLLFGGIDVPDFGSCDDETSNSPAGQRKLYLPTVPKDCVRYTELFRQPAPVFVAKQCDVLNGRLVVRTVMLSFNDVHSHCVDLALLASNSLHVEFQQIKVATLIPWQLKVSWIATVMMMHRITAGLAIALARRNSWTSHCIRP